MEPRITLITLGVSDLARSVRFYRDGLGIPTTYKDGDPIAFFDTTGTKFSVFPIQDLAHDISPDLKPSIGAFSGITIAHNVRTREEVARPGGSRKGRCGDRQTGAGRVLGRT